MSSERVVFDFCDSFKADNGKAPSAAAILEACGGGKKEVLEHRRNWESLKKENPGGLPTSTYSDLIKVCEFTEQLYKSKYEKREEELIKEIESLRAELAKK